MFRDFFIPKLVNSKIRQECTRLSYFVKKGGEILGLEVNDLENFSIQDKGKEYFDFLFFWFVTNIFLNSLIVYIFRNYHSFKSTREKPKSAYLLKNDNFSDTDYYGYPNKILKKYCRWDYNKIIDRNDNKLKGYTDFRISSEFIYLNILGINKNFIIRVKKDIGYLLLEDVNNKIITNFADEFSGLQQIFPLLLQIFIENLNYGSCFYLIEQPELHLHPKFQSLISEIFSKPFNISISNKLKEGNVYDSEFSMEVIEDIIKLPEINKCYFLIETHSEHLIKKFQILVAKGELDRNMLNILYIDSKKGKMNCKQMILDDNGFFTEPWPDGFFDESMNLNIELLTVRKN